MHQLLTNAHLHCAAFVEGAEAHRSGEATEANPYSRTAIAGMAWLAGWCDGLAADVEFTDGDAPGVRLRSAGK